MTYIDTLESSDDFVFIHVMTHGGYDSQTDDSSCRMQDEYQYQNPDTMYSSEFATSLNNFESENIFVLVGSCHSGGFVDDLEGSDRFIISSTDTDNYAWPWKNHGSIPNVEPSFEHFFFLRISQGYSDRSSYFYAVTETQNDWPNQEPMYDDQIAYPWFEWW